MAFLNDEHLLNLGHICCLLIPEDITKHRFVKKVRLKKKRFALI